MGRDNFEEIERIFLTAADLPAAEQDRYLDAACDGQPDLRTEVESLLASDRKQGAGIQAAVANEASLLVDSPFPGETVGAYRIVRQVGRGGMGVVYLATRDDDQYRKQVAIKIVKRGMDSAEVLARFRYERQILANLNHPYIASLYDGGTTADGRPFFVMEYVEGRPLDTYAREEGLDVDARCRLFLRICEAVAHAHRGLVVHRDLKPGNIFVTADGTPKLLDFGVAKLFHVGSNQTTVSLRRSFTPDYASPEQVSGLPVSTATDIYSLGAVLYELLTGRVAHRLSGDTPQDVQRAVCETEVIRPSALVPRLDSDLDNIVLMAMRKEPERRYSSVDQFAEDVRCYLESRPVLARKDSLSYRCRKFVVRHRYTLTAASAVLASLVLGIVVALSEAREARIARRNAELNRDVAIGEQKRAEERLAQILNLSNRSLSDVYALMERLPGAMPARKEMIGTTLDFLENLSKEARSDSRLRWALAKAYLRLGDLQGDPDSPNIGDMAAAGRSYQAALALTGPTPPSGDLANLAVWADLQDKTAKFFNETGDHARAEATLKSAIPVLEAAPDTMPGKSRLRTTLYLSLSRVLVDFPQALKYAEEALRAAGAALSQKPDDSGAQLLLSTAYTQVGFVHLLMGDPEAAAEPYARAMAMRERLGREHPNDTLFRRYQKLAYEHYAALMGSPDRVNLARPDIARIYYKKALPLEQADLADPQNSSARFDYALFQLVVSEIAVPQSELADSLATLRSAAATFESLSKATPGFERYDRSLAVTRVYIGHRLLAMGQASEAMAEYRKAQAGYRKLIESDPKYLRISSEALEAEWSIALLLAHNGDKAGALEQVRKAAEMVESVGKDADREPNRAKADLTTAQVYQRLGNCAMAMPAAERSIRRLRSLGKLVRYDPYQTRIQSAEALVKQCSEGGKGSL